MKKHIFVAIICLLSSGLIISDWKNTPKDLVIVAENKKEKDSSEDFFEKLPPICKGCACIGALTALVLHGIGVCIEKAEESPSE